MLLVSLVGGHSRDHIRCLHSQIAAKGYATGRSCICFGNCSPDPRQVGKTDISPSLPPLLRLGGPSIFLSTLTCQIPHCLILEYFFW